MPFETRVFVLAKDPQHPEQFQDAFGLNAASGIAAVADGVSSALFSRQWAQIVTLSVVADPPHPGEKDLFTQWLAQRRQEWSAQIDTSGLAWFQKAKLPGGAFSTLLWIRLLPVDEEEAEGFGACRLHGFAIGDSCLFHVRGGEIVRSFPIEQSEELEANPIVLGSVDLNRDDYLEFHELDVQCYVGDVIVLCTDAIADWALRRAEEGNPPNWNDYWNMTEEQWHAEINELRESRGMRYDDATLVLLRVLPEGTAVRPLDGSPNTFLPVEGASPEPEKVVQAAPAEIRKARPDVVEKVVEREAAPEEQEYEEPEDEEPEDEGEEEDEEEREGPGEEGDDWKEKFKTAGEQLAEGIEMASGKAIRGLKGWMKKFKKKK